MRRITSLFVFLLTALLFALPAFSQDVISTAIGGGPNGMPALDANLNEPAQITVDSSGNYYIAAYTQNRVFKVSTSGELTVFAGNGLAGYSGDGVTGGAANAMLNGPNSVAADASGNVYIADYSNYVIRKVDTTNTITTIAGTQGVCGGSVSTLCEPSGVAVDTLGNLFIADTGECQVKKFVLSSLTMSIYVNTAATCGYSGDGGNATAAELNYPVAVAVDGNDNVFIADLYNYVIREVTKSNLKIKTVAGDNALGYGYSGDGGPAISAQITYVYGLTVNSAGTTVDIADFYNLRIRQFTVGGNINTVAGSGSAGFCGDGGLATAACLYYPDGVALGSSGTIYVSDTYNNRVRTFTVGGDINTVAGNGSATMSTPVNGVPANGVEFYYPWGIDEDPSGNVYVADQSNEMVRELVQSTGLVNIFAGTGVAGFTGDGGLATVAELNNPDGVARDSSGNIYISDEYNCAVREVNASTGDITTIAGIDTNEPNASCGYSGDGGPATSAQLYYPDNVFVDSKNNIYIADTENHVIRVVTAGTINTIAGIPNEPGYSGDGGPATGARLSYPSAVSEDGAGNLYIADQYNHRIREINAVTGIITTVAGNGQAGFSGDGIATQNSLYYPTGVSADVNGNLFIADQSNNRLRWVSTGGIMTTFAGNGTAGYNGDGGPATSAELYYPANLWEDASGNFLVADEYNYRVRAITAFAALNTSAGSLNFPLESVGATTPPQQLIVSAVGSVTINNISISGTSFSESDDCPSTLANTATCTVYVYFAPKAGGALTGTLTINDNGLFSSVSTVALSGTGSAISLTGAPVAFGNELVKTTSAVKSVTVKNNGTSAITMGTITLDETTDFAISSNTCPASGSTLASKKTCVISLTFTPQTTGAKKGAVIINDNDPSSPQIIGLTGTGTSNVTLAPNSIAFAATPVGAASAVTKVTLTNNTGVSITLNTPAISVTGPFLSTAATTCTNGLVIAALGTCIIDVEFKPTTVGYASGTLSVSDTDVTSPQTVALSGTGTAMRFSPASINFGSVAKGQQVSSTVTLINGGTTTVTISGYDMAGANSADFTYSAPCGPTITGGSSCTLTMYFDPSTTGAEKATFKVFDNASGSPQTLALSGTGH
jgi:sugar lactone lactonase YvrE